MLTSIGSHVARVTRIAARLAFLRLRWSFAALAAVFGVGCSGISPLPTRGAIQRQWIYQVELREPLEVDDSLIPMVRKWFEIGPEFERVQRCSRWERTFATQPASEGRVQLREVECFENLVGATICVLILPRPANVLAMEPALIERGAGISHEEAIEVLTAYRDHRVTSAPGFGWFGNDDISSIDRGSSETWIRSECQCPLQTIVADFDKATGTLRPLRSIYEGVCD